MKVSKLFLGTPGGPSKFSEKLKCPPKIYMPRRVKMKMKRRSRRAK